MFSSTICLTYVDVIQCELGCSPNLCQPNLRFPFSQMKLAVCMDISPFLDNLTLLRFPLLSYLASFFLADATVVCVLYIYLLEVPSAGKVHCLCSQSPAMYLICDHLQFLLRVLIDLTLAVEISPL